jgi:RimJ/RimL family protein N-acetyltransferase
MESKQAPDSVAPQGPIINLRGDKVGLGPIRRDLAPLYQSWINDFEVSRTLAIGLTPITLEAEYAWYDQPRNPKETVMFTIYELATSRPVGNTGLEHIDQQNRTAELGLLIGEKKCWGKGYGTEAVSLMLDYGFTGLGLHSIMLHYYSCNQRAGRAYSRAGFKAIGRRREALYRGGRYYDLVYMDCLANDFSSPVLGKLFLAED